MGTGLLPDSIQDSVDRIADGARKAGRNPADINKLVFTKSNIAETQERAVEEIKMALAASAHHAFRFTLEDKNVPDQYKEPIENLIEEYVPQHHEELGENPNKGLVDKYDLSEYLADRFAVTGTVDQCTQQYKRILDFDGVDGIFITALMEDDAEFISTVGSEIKPELV
jgi:alkanesulfonate monooxygenase SsuD/methylene tetrahydromethanopterin reductase-like flavin-dependent oxidoreductase (luciferase family)